MVNPFTASAKISRIQQDVLRPLYTMYSGQENIEHSWLLVETGRAIARHQSFIEEVCCSRLVAVIFKIVKLLGGADQLTEEDFDRFTGYVTDGGIRAMVKMLLASEKEKTFVDELQHLPVKVRENAPQMLEKSKSLHKDFITGFFKENYGTLKNTPEKLQDNLSKSNDFIERLTHLAMENLKRTV
ncbi:MAG: hypothetical protein GY799_12025 [Desulfobulbaceae bacterium]|nr:hypothetical protein [Desulfobulbaceae bacterium]